MNERPMSVPQMNKEPQRAIHAELELLKKVVHEADQESARLLERLSPVLTPVDQPAEVADKKPAAENLSPVAAEIDLLTCRLTLVVQRLNDIANRREV